jgi:hypothetical protein
MGNSPEAWKKFTIWGGAPADPKTCEPVPFSLDDEEKDHSLTKQYDPGFRVVMRRALAAGWLAVARRSALEGGPPTARTIEKLEAIRAAALEVASQEQRREVDARTAFYRALVLYRLGQAAQAQEHFKASRPEFGGSGEVAALPLTGPTAGGDTAPPPRADEPTFIDVFSHLVARDP